jgi:hypothetical protein
MFVGNWRMGPRKWLFVDMGWMVERIRLKTVFVKSEVQEECQVVIAGVDFEVAGKEEHVTQRLDCLEEIDCSMVADFGQK